MSVIAEQCYEYDSGTMHEQFAKISMQCIAYAYAQALIPLLAVRLGQSFVRHYVV